MAAGPTYSPLATVTASGVTSFLVMSSIPNTYTDLILVGKYLKSGAGSARLIFNSDSSSGSYSQSVLYSGGAGRENSINYFYLMDYLQSSTTNPNISVTQIMNYANTNVFKTLLDRSGAADKGTSVQAGLWRSTSAITRIDIADASNFSTGTTFTLYGIKAA